METLGQQYLTMSTGYSHWKFMETYSGKYAGTANRIYSSNGTNWKMLFRSREGACYTISMITSDDKIYAGTGKGHIFVNPSPDLEYNEMVVPEFPSSTILYVL